jgi:prevent-host-death family protein
MASAPKRKTPQRTRTSSGRGWKLEDAKARFSEVVRLARSEGPQRVSVRGKDAVVVVSADEFARLSPAKPEMPFVEFMQSLAALGELDVTRDRDTGRDIEL